MQSSRTDQVVGRLDAVLIAARVAPLTRGIGLMPTVIVTHTEPFHISKAIATLDYVSNGRAGVQVRVSGSMDEAVHIGRRVRPLPAAELLDEAAGYVEVVRRLWDSWEDDAEIRDAVTGRFVDRDKLHYIDFTDKNFSVKGPSITPRPPQGQPVVSALGHGPGPYRLIATSADVGCWPRNGTGGTERAHQRLTVSWETPAVALMDVAARGLGDPAHLAAAQVDVGPLGTLTGVEARSRVP